MKVPNEVVEGYLKEIPSQYQTEVLDFILSKDSDKEEAEKAALEFYTAKNEGVEPKIRWVRNPVVLREEYQGKEVQIFSTYFNVNWVYFFFTFMDYLKKNRDKIDPQIITQYEKTEKESILAYKIFKNCFGVTELPVTVDGKEVKYGEIILIEKPELVKVESDRLHSIDSPAFMYEDGPTYYYVEGVQLTEEEWARTIVTGLADEHSPVSETLVDSQKKNVREYISKLEAKNGKAFKPWTVKDIMTIDNSEVKSKVIKLVGYAFILESAEVLNEESITTHKGEIMNYQLLAMDLGLEHDKIPSRFVRVACWSTGREYVLMVNPRDKQCDTAMGAIAWTCRKPDGSRCTVEEYMAMEFQT